MIYSAKKLLGKKIQATDDEFGSCKDFLFDDLSFRIRYLSLDTGNWLPGRKILLTPQVIDSLDNYNLDDGIPVKLDREQVESSPSVDEDRPFSRQVEVELHSYYGWHPYWLPEPATPLYAGETPAAATIQQGTNDLPPEMNIKETGDPHLRSLNEVRGYTVRPADTDSSGPLHDLLIDSSDWRIKYAVVNTRPWFMGEHKVIPVESIKYVDYAQSEIGVTLTAEQIKEACDEPKTTMPVVFEEERSLSNL